MFHCDSRRPVVSFTTVEIISGSHVEKRSIRQAARAIRGHATRLGAATTRQATCAPFDDRQTPSLNLAAAFQLHQDRGTERLDAAALQIQVFFLLAPGYWNSSYSARRSKATF